MANRFPLLAGAARVPDLACAARVPHLACAARVMAGPDPATSRRAMSVLT